jgi:hypothetical protein
LHRYFRGYIGSVVLIYDVQNKLISLFIMFNNEQRTVASLISARKGNGLIFSREKKKCYLVLHFAYKATSVDGLIDGPRDVSHP